MRRAKRTLLSPSLLIAAMIGGLAGGLIFSGSYQLVTAGRDGLRAAASGALAAARRESETELPPGEVIVLIIGLSLGFFAGVRIWHYIARQLGLSEAEISSVTGRSAPRK
jgi:hypothetical protein